MDYLIDSIRRDPIALLVAVGAFACAIQNRQPRLIFAAFGFILRCGYLIWIGGDFMSSRFLATMYLVSVVLVSVSLKWNRLTGHPLVAATLLIGCWPAPLLFVRDGQIFQKDRLQEAWSMSGPSISSRQVCQRCCATTARFRVREQLTATPCG